MSDCHVEQSKLFSEGRISRQLQTTATAALIYADVFVWLDICIFGLWKWQNTGIYLPNQSQRSQTSARAIGN